MKKFLLLLLLASMHYVGAMDKSVTIPKREVLQERLNDLCVQGFAEKTDILRYAEKELPALSVVMLVESSIYKYIESIKVGASINKEVRLRSQMELFRLQLLRALLKHEPTILATLKKEFKLESTL